MLNSILSDLLKSSNRSTKWKRDAQPKSCKKRGTGSSVSSLPSTHLQSQRGTRRDRGDRDRGRGLTDHEEGELRLPSHSRKLSLRATMPCCIGWAGVGQVRPGLTQRLLDLFCHPRRVIGSGCHHLNPILLSFRKLFLPGSLRGDSL